MPDSLRSALRRGLARPTLWLIVAALVTIAGSITILAVTTDDVREHNGLYSTDPAHLRLFTDHRAQWVIDAARFVTQAGTAPLLIVLSVVAAAILWWRGAPLLIAATPAVALGVAATATAIGKQVVHRPRPPVALRLVTETEPSFPSGHATDSTALFVAIALVLAVFVFHRVAVRVLIVAAGFATAAAVGVSRLVLGVHWPTDVLAGWALGTVVALFFVLVAASMSPEFGTPRHLGTVSSRR